MESYLHKQKVLSILLVEDNPGDAYIIREFFKAETDKFSFTHSANLTKTKQLLEENAFDAILLDLGLPESIGLDTLKKIKASELKAPIIVLTGLNDEEIALESLKEGAQDYLIKNNLSYENISHSIKYSIQRKKLQEIQKRNTLQFSTLSSATGTINECADIPSIYTAICNHFYELLDDSVIVGFEISENSNTYLMCSKGMESYYEKIKRLACKEKKFVHRISEHAQNLLRSTSDGRLNEVDGAFFDFINKNHTKEIGAAIEKALGSHKMYVLNFVKDGKHYGGTIIFSKFPVKDEDIKIIEAIGSQASLNIHRRVVEKNLILSEKRYKSIFMDAPIPKTEEDYSEVKKELDKLKEDGIKDLRKYLKENNKLVKKWVSGIKITDLNPAVLHFHKAGTKEQFLNNRDVIFSEGTYQGFIEEFILLFEGHNKFDLEKELFTINGEKKNVLIRWTVAEGYEQTLERVMISVIDLTEIKKSQESLRKLNEELEQKVQDRTKDLATTNEKLQYELEERKKAETELVRLNRTLKALGKSSQAMMYSEKESQYLQKVCKIIVEDCGHTLVWIGYAMDDENKTVKPVADYGFEEGYLEKLNISWADTERGHGPTGKAIQKGKPAICRNIYTDPDFEPWRKEALKRGYNSSVVIPMKIDGKPFGALNIYSKETDPFTNSEIELLNDIVADLVHGIITIRLQEYEKLASELIKESEKKLWSVLNAANESIYMFDREGNFTLSNATGLKRLNNISEKELIGHNFSEFMPLELAKSRQKKINEVIRTGEAVEFEDERDSIIFHHNFFPVIKESKVTNIVAYSTDITERTQIENALMFLLNVNDSDNNFFESLAKFLTESLSMDFVCIDELKTDLQSAKTLTVYFDGKFDDNIEYTLKETPCGDVVGKNICSFKENVRQLFPNDAVLQEMRAESYLGATLWSSVGKPIGLIALISRKPRTDLSIEETVLKLVAIRAAGELERLQAEGLLKNSEIRYRRLFESAKDGILILDADSGMIVDVNPSLIKRLGYSHDMFLCKTIWDIGLFKDIISNKDKFIELQQNEFVRYDNLPLETAVGSRINVEFVSNVYMVNQQKVIQCNIRDITERYYFEKALKESEENYHRLFEYSAIPIWKDDYSEIKKYFDRLKFSGVSDFRNYFDTHKDEVDHLASLIKVIEINQKSVEFFDAENKEDIIKNMLFYFNKESLDVFREEIIVLAEGGKRFESEMPIRTLSGEIKILQLHVSVVAGYEFTLANVLVSFIDITNRKRFENELKEKNAQLKESNDSKDKFFKIIAHDMKNPFISLLGASELLYENAPKYNTDKIATLAKVMNDSAKSGYDMLLNLLEWSKSQAGSMLFQPEKINLKDLVERNLSNLKEFASNKKINLIFDFTDNFFIQADTIMLVTILRNLINNALKYTPAYGQVTVGVKEEDGVVVIFVKDTGVGINNNDFEKLFRTDIKFSNPGTDQEGGSGLGLLLCKEFVENHSGKIWVESEIGKGSTFYFSLKNCGSN